MDAACPRHIWYRWSDRNYSTKVECTTLGLRSKTVSATCISFFPYSLGLCERVRFPGPGPRWGVGQTNCLDRYCSSPWVVDPAPFPPPLGFRHLRAQPRWLRRTGVACRLWMRPYHNQPFLSIHSSQWDGLGSHGQWSKVGAYVVRGGVALVNRPAELGRRRHVEPAVRVIGYQYGRVEALDLTWVQWPSVCVCASPRKWLCERHSDLGSV